MPQQTNNMQGPRIRFDNLSLELGNTQILDKVSFEVAAGSVHCVIGANGGGKTSLLRSLLGQMPHRGQIHIDWQDNQTIGYVPQQLDFDKTLPISVMDFMTMICQRRPVFFGTRADKRELIEAALERVGLIGKRKRKLGSLSGGERQRVLFAQALIPQPALLILDEPSTGLDVDGAERMEQILEEFKTAGATILWVNHDIGQVFRLADRLTYINREVLLDGPPKEQLRSQRGQQIYPTLNQFSSMEAAG